MLVEIWFFVILVVCLFITLGAGVFYFRRTQTLEDYYVARQEASPVLVAGSWAATWISGGALVGIVAVVYTVGYSAIMTWFFAIWVLPITFLFVAKKARHFSQKWASLTWCEMIGRRYNSVFLRGLMACIIILFIFFAMIAQLKIGGIIFEVVSPIPYAYAVILATAIVTIFVTLGGMRSVLFNDTFLCIIMAVSVIIMFFVAFSQVGWFKGLETALIADPVGYKMAAAAGFGEESSLAVNLLTSANHFDLRPGLGEFSLIGTLGWGLALALGSAALPHQASRFLAVRRLDKPVFKKLVFWTSLFIIILSLSIYFGLFGRALLGPEYLGNADYVTPILALRLLPGPLAGLVLTAIMFAIVTTVSTFFYVVVTTFSRDLVQGVIKPSLSSNITLKITRYASMIVGLLAMILAITNPPELMMLFHYLINPGLGFTFFFSLIVGFYWKRATKWGAISSIIGVTVATIYLRFILNWPQGPLFFWMFILCFILFVGVSLITKPPEQEILDDLFPSKS